MKIVCLIGTPAYLHYFVNTISEHHEIACVIREDARTGGGLLRKIRSKGLMGTAKLLVNRIRGSKKTVADNNAVFGERWRSLSDRFPVLTTENINNAEVVDQLRLIKPDLVLVHGTTLIKNKTLEDIPLVLNLHWGLSPYYKGSHCTAWALLNHDPYNIGFTIHRISAKIDGGDVLTQGRLAIRADDTVYRINMRLTKAATAAMIQVIERLKKNEQPVFQSQDNARGRLYLVKHWTPKQEKEIAKLENTVALSKMLNNPAETELPIVEWV